MTETNTIITFIFGSLLFTLFAFFIILYIIVQKRKQIRHILEKQEMQHKFSKEVLKIQLEVQEQTSRNLSEEIHDNIGPVLSFAKLNMHNISSKTDDDSLRKYANESKEHLTQAIADLRTISHTLNGSYILKAGLIPSVEKELGYVSTAKEINCTFDTRGDIYPLGEEKELLIFRIIQESVANIIKHAAAENIKIDAVYEENRFSVSISDDGIGFEGDGDHEDAGIGLNNMHNRARLLGGNLTISSTKNAGTTIYLIIPVTDE